LAELPGGSLCFTLAAQICAEFNQKDEAMLQEDHKFEARLGYNSETLSQKNKNKTQKTQTQRKSISYYSGVCTQTFLKIN
jgi:hypothetical protein